MNYANQKDIIKFETCLKNGVNFSKRFNITPRISVILREPNKSDLDFFIELGSKILKEEPRPLAKRRIELLRVLVYLAYIEVDDGFSITLPAFASQETPSGNFLDILNELEYNIIKDGYINYFKKILEELTKSFFPAQNCLEAFVLRYKERSNAETN